MQSQQWKARLKNTLQVSASSNPTKFKLCTHQKYPHTHKKSDFLTLREATAHLLWRNTITNKDQLSTLRPVTFRPGQGRTCAQVRFGVGCWVYMGHLNQTWIRSLISSSLQTPTFVRHSSEQQLCVPHSTQMMYNGMWATFSPTQELSRARFQSVPGRSKAWSYPVLSLGIFS